MPDNFDLMGHKRHKEDSPKSVNIWVITVSDTRSESDDESGALILERLQNAGHTVLRRSIVPDDPERILALLADASSGGKADAVIMTGGTGIAPRDTTIEAVSGFIEKEISGFGELFRRLSYDEIGSAAILSRATAGVGKGIIVFALPGSKNAVRLAMDKIILPEIGHAVYEIRKKK